MSAISAPGHCASPPKSTPARLMSGFPAPRTKSTGSTRDKASGAGNSSEGAQGHDPRPTHVMATRDWLLLLALAACFSGSFFFNRVALAELPPLTIVLGRVGLGAVTLNVVLLLRGERLPTGWANWRAFLVMGALSNAL